MLSSLKTILFALIFVSGTISIWSGQTAAKLIRPISPLLYDKTVSYNKRKFAVLMVAISHIFTKTRIQLILPPSLAAQARGGGSPLINWKHRAVVIANHQLYNDWVYGWWLSYTANIHEAPIIMLKESLRKIPVFGWCAESWNYLFMARSWQVDQKRIAETMKMITSSPPSAANWLFMFPEGTVTSANTVERTRAYADELGRPHPRNVLVPRTRGLKACLEGLGGGVETLYDLTIYYDGIPEGEYGENVYTLSNTYFNNNYPKTVKIHVREFQVKDIPLDSAQFDAWLYKVWDEKDKIMDSLRKETPYTIESAVTLRSWWELLNVYAFPLAVAVIVLLLR